LTEADVPVTLGPPTLLDPGVSAAGRTGGLGRPAAPPFAPSTGELAGRPDTAVVDAPPSLAHFVRRQ